MATPLEVQLSRSKSQPTLDQPLWALIRDRTNAISPDRHAEFIDQVLCKGLSDTKHHHIQQRLEALGPQLHGAISGRVAERK
jgi:hypothetical protein